MVPPLAGDPSTTRCTVNLADDPEQPRPRFSSRFPADTPRGVEKGASMTYDEKGVPANGTGTEPLSCLSVPACMLPLPLFERLAVPAGALPDALSDVRARSGADQV